MGDVTAGMKGSHSPSLAVAFPWELCCSRIVCVRHVWALSAGELVPSWGEAKRNFQVHVFLSASPGSQARSLAAAPSSSVCLPWPFHVFTWVLLSHATLLPQGPSVNEIKCYLLSGVWPTVGGALAHW